MRSCSWTLATLLVTATAASAQSNVLRYPSNTTVEVLGLRRWTVQMVQDSLAKYAPADSLHTHACAVALRHKVGFADAAALTFIRITEDRDLADTVTNIVIVVREPQDSARVRYRPAPYDSTGPRPEFAELIALFRSHLWPFLFAAENYPLHAAKHPTAKEASQLEEDSVHVLRIWQLLSQYNTQRDRAAAFMTLLADPNYHNRVVAAAILGNFPQHDETWWALIEAMREDGSIVVSVATSVATSLSSTAARPVDWTPLLPTLRAMLDGTSPFVLGDLLKILDATQLSREHARALLSDGDMLVYEYLGSLEPALSRPAHTLLVRMSGEDFGYDAARWRAWAASLR